MSRYGIILMVLIAYCTGSAVMVYANAGETHGKKGNGEGRYDHITTSESVRHMVDHPAFNGFGRLLLPREDDTHSFDTPLSNIRSLMPYHGHVNADDVVAALNHMIDDVNDSKTIFYNFYSEQEKRADPTKEHTGLFFYRGEPGAPICRNHRLSSLRIPGNQPSPKIFRQPL